MEINQNNNMKEIFMQIVGIRRRKIQKGRIKIKFYKIVYKSINIQPEYY